MTKNLENLAVTPALDWRHPLVGRFVRSHAPLSMTEREKALSLYSAVRDSIRYDPYRLDLSVEGMRASVTIEKGYGWCVSKAVLLAACCRAVGIPARLGFGDVKNHMSSERLRQRMQSDVFYWHGFTEILLDDRWLKATPAFNRELCEKVGIAPLEFDGTRDSIFHEYDGAGNRYMEYLRQRGTYADLPLEEILATFRRHYPGLLAETGGDFEKEVSCKF